jgi:hypothetical protein
MINQDGRTTWKSGECVISYERNITSLTLVDLQPEAAEDASADDASVKEGAQAASGVEGSAPGAVPLGNTPRKTVKAYIKL